MASFSSFLITKKFPHAKTLRTLLRWPLTGLAALFYGVFFALCATVFLLIITINKKYLVELPAQGGNLTEGVIGAPRFINPLLATTETDQRLIALVYGNLTDDIDTYSFSPDGKIITLTLHPGLRFGDGKPLTSDDVAFTVQKMQDATISHSSEYWQNITIETPDAQTVIFTLPAPDVTFISRMSFNILPKHIWTTIPDESFTTAKQNLHPVGSGAFKVSSISYTDGMPSSVTLKRNKYFIGGQALLRTLTLATYANQTELLSAITNGDIDFTYSLTPETVSLNNLPTSLINTTVTTNEGVNLYRSSNDSALANPSTISTINQSIDKKAIVDTVVYGYGTPSGVLTNPAQAGTATRTNKTISIPGFSIAVENDPQMLLAAQTLAQQLQKIGANVSVKAFDPGAFQKNITAGGFSVFLARSSDVTIPAQYSIALPLYTEALPYVFNTTTHTIISNTLESPTTEYEDVKDWYTNTDKLWKWFRKDTSTQQK
ncbi:MAG: ABC transporter substrate-binding protein [Candidatus Paceibacterota bacterium]